MQKRITFFLLFLSLALNCWASNEQKLEVDVPGGARVTVRVEPRASEIYSTQIGAPVGLHVPRPLAWKDINAQILSDLYRQEYGMDLLNGHRIQFGKRFPILLVESPSSWQTLIERCGRGRTTSNLSKDVFSTLEDVCLDIADQLGWIRSDGKDSSDAGRQLRHVVNCIGLGDEAGVKLINSLGYPAKTKTMFKGLKKEVKPDFD